MKENSYLPHKTFVLNNVSPTIQPTLHEEKKELVEANRAPVLETANSFATTENKKVEENKSTAPVLPLNEKEFATTENASLPAEPLNDKNVTNASVNQNSNANVIYPEHKTFMLNSAVAESNATAITNNETVISNPIQNNPSSEKTGAVENETTVAATEPPINTNKNADAINDSINTKNESIVSNAGVMPANNNLSAKTNYPDHKTFILGIDDIKIPELENIIKPTDSTITIAPENKKEETNSTESKAGATVNEEKKSETTVKPTTKTETVKPSAEPLPSVAIAKAKKPILWIVIAGVLFLMLLGLGWFAFTQYQQLSALKSENEDLKEAVKRTAIDKLHFDDIIARGGTVDEQNNISILESANQVKVIRTCYSIGASVHAVSGNKTVYIRILDSKNNVLLKSNTNQFLYKGKQIPYSLKEEVNYVNEEMLRTVDFTLDKKIEKGTYKIEIYNDEVLDGTASFELK